MGGVESELPFGVRGIEHIRPYALTGTLWLPRPRVRRIFWDNR